MPDSRRTIGVVLAGGTGSRVGLSIPKQLLKVAGKPVMEHTLGIFQDCEAIDEIYILMHPDHLEAARRIGSKFSKVTQVLAGGDTRNDSTKAALRVLGNLNDADTRVMFHDAVRPLLDTRIINGLPPQRHSGCLSQGLGGPRLRRNRRLLRRAEVLP
jgi:ribitol-5-phosphate 2-dehydrogenase (NADP+) / D-ribitol-5-phosphate cytidylyltransferase